LASYRAEDSSSFSYLFAKSLVKATTNILDVAWTIYSAGEFVVENFHSFLIVSALSADEREGGVGGGGKGGGKGGKGGGGGGGRGGGAQNTRRLCDLLLFVEGPRG
jgi:uncharacterized membrane protein